MPGRWVYDRMLPAPAELSAEQRRDVEKRMNEHAMRNTGFRVLFVAMLLVTPVAAVVVGGVVSDWLRSLGLGRIPAALIGPPAVAAVCVLFFIAIAWRMYIKPLRRALRDIGRDVCEHCGYDLREIESQQCPECGYTVISHERSAGNSQ